MIIAIVKATILENAHERLRKVADILQHTYAAHEEGCEQYESFIDKDTFLTIERWNSQQALDAHLKSAHVATYVPQLRACVVDGAFAVQCIKSDDVSFMTL